MNRLKPSKSRFPGPSGLPFPNPFSDSEWSGASLDLALTDRFQGWYSHCSQEIHRKYGSLYADLFSMIAHAGRFPEFGTKGFERFRREATRQNFSSSQLETALDGILLLAGEKHAFQSSAHKWAFLEFVSEVVPGYAEHNGQFTDSIRDAASRVKSLALLTFIVTANEDRKRDACRL